MLMVFNTFLQRPYYITKSTSQLQAGNLHFVCMWWPQNNFLCPNLQVLEIHPAGQIVLQFTTGRDEHKSEPVPSPSAVLPQSLTKDWLNKGPNFMTVFFRRGKWQNDSYENTERSPYLRCKFKGSHHLQPWPQLGNSLKSLLSDIAFCRGET